MEFRNYNKRGDCILIFPYLITELFKKAEIEEYLGDNWISLKTPIYLLKMCGEGTTSNIKNRLIYFC